MELLFKKGDKKNDKLWSMLLAEISSHTNSPCIIIADGTNARTFPNSIEYILLLYYHMIGVN